MTVPAGAAGDAVALETAARVAAAGMAEPVLPPDGADVPPGPAPAALSTVDVLAPLVGAAFRIVAPAWNVTDAEARELASAWAPVLDKYFPGGLLLSVEFNAVIVTLALVGPKWGKPRTLPVPPSAPPPPGDAPLAPVGEG